MYCKDLSMYTYFYERWITTTTFHAPSNVYVHWGQAPAWIRPSCWLFKKCCGSDVFIIMFQNVRLWNSMFLIIKMNINNRPKVFPMIHDNRPLSLVIFQKVIAIHFDILIQIYTNYRILPLNMWKVWCIYHHHSHVTSYCSHVTAHYSCPDHTKLSIQL